VFFVPLMKIHSVLVSRHKMWITLRVNTQFKRQDHPKPDLIKPYFLESIEGASGIEPVNDWVRFR
jgi:hypothetical protein